jgi:rod shape-determining protein MreB and related proteins
MSFLRKLFGFFSSHLAMDLGTANTLIYLKGEGVILNEPSVVAIDNNSGKIVAVGKEAKEYIGRTPPHISAIRPLKDGVIADFDVTKAMIKQFLAMAGKDRDITKPKMVVGVPSGITQVEKKAVIDACYLAGVRTVYLIEEPMAAAIGAKLPIDLPRGNMVVDIGGGTTEVAIISLSAVAYSESLRVAGDELDEAVVRHIYKKYQISIGIIAAERLKIGMGATLAGDTAADTISVVGKDFVSGIPRSIKISAAEIREAIEEPVSAIVDAVRRAMEKVPPELIYDLNESGMVLTGGGALLRGLDRRIQQETGINVYVMDEPLLSVVLGSGMALEDMERYRRVFIN